MPSIIFFLLAMNFKLQAVIFMPLMVLLLLPVLIGQFSWRKIALWIAVPLTLQVIIVLPFWLGGDSENLWHVLSGSMGRYPYVSMNAYNMWYWLVAGDLTNLTDERLFLGLSYKNWGLALFFATSLLALLPLLVNVFAVLLRKGTQISIDKILLIGSLIPLLFFFFNTQMHERYSHPAIIFAAAYSIITKRFFPYILISVAYFLNMEGVLRYFSFLIDNYDVLMFNKSFVAVIYFYAILLFFVDLYRPASFVGRCRTMHPERS
jgi:hypothetical protein